MFFIYHTHSVYKKIPIFSLALFCMKIPDLYSAQQTPSVMAKKHVVSIVQKPFSKKRPRRTQRKKNPLQKDPYNTVRKKLSMSQSPWAFAINGMLFLMMGGIAYSVMGKMLGAFSGTPKTTRPPSPILQEEMIHLNKMDIEEMPYGATSIFPATSEKNVSEFLEDDTSEENVSQLWGHEVCIDEMWCDIPEVPPIISENSIWKSLGDYVPGAKVMLSLGGILLAALGERAVNYNKKKIMESMEPQKEKWEHVETISLKVMLEKKEKEEKEKGEKNIEQFLLNPERNALEDDALRFFTDKYAGRLKREDLDKIPAKKFSQLPCSALCIFFIPETYNPTPQQIKSITKEQIMSEKNEFWKNAVIENLLEVKEGQLSEDITRFLEEEKKRMDESQKERQDNTVDQDRDFVRPELSFSRFLEKKKAQEENLKGEQVLEQEAEQAEQAREAEERQEDEEKAPGKKGSLKDEDML